MPNPWCRRVLDEKRIERKWQGDDVTVAVIDLDEKRIESTAPLTTSPVPNSSLDEKRIESFHNVSLPSSR